MQSQHLPSTLIKLFELCDLFAARPPRFALHFRFRDSVRKCSNAVNMQHVPASRPAGGPARPLCVLGPLR